MKQITETNFYVVHGWMRMLGLKGLQLELYAIIYGFCQDNNSAFYGTISYLEEFTGYSRRAVIDALQSLVREEYLIRSEEDYGQFKRIRYTCNQGKISTGVVQNLHGGSAEFAPNNKDIYINNIHNDNKETKTINSFSKEKSSNYPLTNPTNVVKGSTKTEGINLKNKNSHEVTLSPHTTPAPPSLTREEREDKFRAEAEMYEAEYGERMIRAFCDYWTEFGGKKMRFEKEKTWELKRRLQTWKRNDEERKARYTRQPQTQPQAQYSEVPTMDAKKYIEEYEKKHRF